MMKEKSKADSKALQQQNEKVPAAIMLATRQDKLLWGVHEFFLGKKQESNLFTSYQKWYEGISSLLGNRIQENVKQGEREFVFIRKEMTEQHYKTLYLYTRRKEKFLGENDFSFIVHFEDKGKLKNAKTFVLHPKQRNQCINCREYNNYGSYEQWVLTGVAGSHYFGEKRSVIAFFYF